MGRTGLLAAGIFAAASLTWTGGLASAAQLAVKIPVGSQWTSEAKEAGGGAACELQTFKQYGYWKADVPSVGDRGTYVIKYKTTIVQNQRCMTTWVVRKQMAGIPAT